jgi:outer membrane protein assembly factor BamB
MHAVELAALTLLVAANSLLAANWPQFRGPEGRAIADEGKPPIHFGPTTNVLWKTVLPSGASSPCIWGERIFLTTFDKKKIETACLDRRDGRILWRRSVPTDKFEATHRLGSPAASTPACDGERVYTYFGSFGVVAYDLEGQEQWYHELPPPVVEFGTGTSPILAGGLLLVNCDQDLNSFLLALNARTGKEVWRADRSEFRRGFSSPFLWKHGGVEEIVLPGSIWLKSYGVLDGRELWRVRGLARVVCASPTSGDGLLFAASWNVGGDEGDRLVMPPFAQVVGEWDKNNDGKLSRDEFQKGPFLDRYAQIDFDKDGFVTQEEWDTVVEIFAKAENAVLAIKPGGRGDITRSHVAWKQTRSLPYVSSPLFYQGRVYTVKNGGLASCYDGKTGKVHYQDERLGENGAALGDFYSSAVGADGKVYLASQKGMVIVLQAGDTFRVLARNDLKEQVFATPAIADGKIYLRTEGGLYAFGQ